MRFYYSFTLILLILQSGARVRARNARLPGSRSNSLRHERENLLHPSAINVSPTIGGNRNTEKKELLRLTAQRLLGFDQSTQFPLKRKENVSNKSLDHQRNGYNISRSTQAPPSLPDFMLHLHQIYSEDQNFMKSQATSKGDTIRSFFPVADQHTNDSGTKMKEMVIVPYHKNKLHENAESKIHTNSNNEMLVFSFNLSSIPLSEILIGAKLKTFGQYDVPTNSSTFQPSKSFPQFKTAFVAVYEIKNQTGNNQQQIYRRRGPTITARTYRGLSWASPGMIRLASKARHHRRLVVVKFASGENSATNQRKAGSFVTLPSAFTRQPELSKSIDRTSARKDVQFIPMLITYCNDTKKMDFTSEKLPPGIWSKLESLNEETKLKRNRRLAWRQRNTKSLLTSNGKMKNELPGENSDSDVSTTSSFIRNDQTELYENNLSDRRVMQTLEDRKSKSRQRKIKKRRSRRCKNRNHKRKKSRCNRISTQSTVEPDLNRATQSCSRRSLRVDFEEIGWSEWIISPKHFDAYFCSGACEFNTIKDLSPSNHAIVQSFINKFQINPEVPKPCCVPESLQSLSVLYFDQNDSVVLKVYPDMSVEKCACR